MPPPRDLSGVIIMDFNQNAENRCICHPEIQIYTNIFKFKTGVLCYVRQVAALLVLATICRRPVTLTFGVLCYNKEIWHKLVISSLFHKIKLSIYLYSIIYTKMITLYYYKHCSVK